MTPAQVKPVISPEVLNQIAVRVGTIGSVTDVPNSEKLLALRVNFGDHGRTGVAGMKRERANPREIEGKQLLFVVNLPPAQDGRSGFRSHALRHRLFGRDRPGAGDAGIEGA